MNQDNIAKKREEMARHPIVMGALRLLARDLPKGLSYHGIEHTEDVLNEVILFAVTDALSDRQIELLAIAAACHDLGFVKSPVMNEPIGAAYAREEMERAGSYANEEVDLVERMILDTALVDTGNGPRQIPSTDLSRYLLDADLSNFGRDDFFDKGELQRQELGADKELFQKSSYTLLSSHRWLTNAARALRQKKKEQNLSLLKSLVTSQPDAAALSFDRLGFLARLPLLLNSNLDTQKVIKVALDELKNRLNARAATIFLLDDDGSTLRFWALQGPDNQRLEGREIPANVGIVGWAIQNQEALIVNDAAHDPRFFSQIDKEVGFNTRSIVCAPLSVRDQSRLGAVQVLNKIDGPFTSEDLEFVVQFSHQVALAIENSQLYEAVALRTQQLEQVDSRKNELMLLLASELRDPVTAIGTSAELLGSGALNDGLMVEATCHTLTQSVERVSKLVADFRNLSIATTGTISPERGHCAIAPLLTQVVATFSFAANRRQVALSVDAPATVGGCVGDAPLLQVVLSNLISNALSNTPDGGRVTTRASRADGLVTIEVIDTGAGMTPQQIVQAFDAVALPSHITLPNQPLSFGAKGLGLGLPAARAILHAHGTTLNIRSSPGKGSTFFFSLPESA